VVSEWPVENLIPDLVVAGSRRLVVVVAVTHQVDLVKQRRLVQMGYATLEVELSHYYRDAGAGSFDAVAFRGKLLYGV